MEELIFWSFCWLELGFRRLQKQGENKEKEFWPFWGLVDRVYKKAQL